MHTQTHSATNIDCGALISRTPVTFCRKSGNYCPNLMILSALWTEIICIQTQTKICHRTLILLLHYLAKANRRVHNYRTPWLSLYKLSTNSQKLITFKYLAEISSKLCSYKQHFNSSVHSAKKIIKFRQ